MGVQLHFEIWFMSRMIGALIVVSETILNLPPTKGGYCRQVANQAIGLVVVTVSRIIIGNGAEFVVVFRDLPVKEEILFVKRGKLHMVEEYACCRM
jgi:hypothetical protein